MQVAEFYEEGFGTSKQLDAALEWYQRAASLGSPAAHFRLADAHATGALGLPVNPRLSTQWRSTGLSQRSS